MATKTITQLPSASPLQGDELFEAVQVSGSFPVSVKVTGDQIAVLPKNADAVNFNNLNATYKTVQDGLNQLMSSGWISGGVIKKVSSNTINVSGGAGIVRTSDSSNAPLVFIDWADTYGIPISLDTERWIVVKYNSGSPIVVAETHANTNQLSMIPLGEVSNLDNEVYVNDAGSRALDFRARMLGRLYSTNPVARAYSTGLILGESADFDRFVTMSSGDVWNLLEIEAVNSIDTSGVDRFVTYYRDGSGGYTEGGNVSKWPMTDYDGGLGFLQTMNSGRYNSLWFYLIPYDNSLHMIYGRSNERSLSEAEAEAAPDDIPQFLREHSVLIGRIVFRRSNAIAVEVQSAFDNLINYAAATDHGNLGGLLDDDHPQYALVDGSRPIADLNVLNTLDVSGASGQLRVTPETIEFQTDEDSPSWAEGKVSWDKVNHTMQIYNEQSDMAIQVGQEMIIAVRNETGQTITNGSPTYFAGASSVYNRPLIGLAKADNQLTLISPALATHDIPNNSNGYVTKRGIVRDIDTSGLIAGAPVYVSATEAGELVQSRPISPLRTAVIGIVTISHATSGAIYVEPAQLADGMKIISFTLPLTGVVDTIVPLAGTFRTVGAGATGDVATDWAVSNQHAFILVNSITGSGDITITGTSLNESTAVPSANNTEILPSVSATGYYQTDLKWWEIIDIDIPAGITAIDYDYGVIGYPDQGNRDFRMLGYRCDAYSSSSTSDFSLIIYKVQDDGNKKMSIVTIESISVDSGPAGDQIIDNLRTGADDRSYNPSVGNIWLDNTTITFKQLDFANYFTGDEVIFEGKNKHEGYLISIEGEPPASAITAVDFIVIKIYYELI